MTVLAPAEYCSASLLARTRPGVNRKAPVRNPCTEYKQEVGSLFESDL